AVLAQTRAPDSVIVVDNASEDGTADTVRKAFPGVQLAELARNSGGAGGFAAGMALALAGAADLIWLMDDDTVPEPGALAALLAARDQMAAQARPPALIASRVLWTDGRAHPLNTPRPGAPPRAPGRSRQRRRSAPPPLSAACRSAPRRSCPCWSTPLNAAAAGCHGPPTSCGTTTSSSPHGCCAAISACSARRASWC